MLLTITEQQQSTTAMFAWLIGFLCTVDQKSDLFLKRFKAPRDDRAKRLGIFFQLDNFSSTKLMRHFARFLPTV